MAVFRISKHIQRHGFKGRLNQRMLHLHSLSFSMYLFSSLVVYWNYFNYLFGRVTPDRVLIIRAITQIIKFIAELALVAIFYEK